MDIIICGIVLAVALAIFCVGYYMGIRSTGNYTDMECDIYVQSLSTGYKYHASQYRITKRGPEICIYNWTPGEFTWHSVWHFESASQIVAYLMPDYAREHYKMNKMPDMTKNDFTKKPKKAKSAQKYHTKTKL